MHLRSVRQIDGLSAEVTQTLGSLVDRARQPSVQRTGVHRESDCWRAAELRTTMAAATADVLVGTTADGSLLMATQVALVAHAALGAPVADSVLSSRAATGAFDAAVLATWLRDVTAALGGNRGIGEEAVRLARAVLAHPALTPDMLADAWITVCGHALLQELAGSSVVPDAEVRLIQRTVASTLSRLGLVSEPRIARLTGVDRLTLADWLRLGPPSAHSRNSRISAPVCAVLTGMTSQDWRCLDSYAQVPAACGDVRGARSWDEAEVVRWCRSHSADQCQQRCQRHAAAQGRARVAGGGRDLDLQAGTGSERPYLALVR